MTLWIKGIAQVALHLGGSPKPQLHHARKSPSLTRQGLAIHALTHARLPTRPFPPTRRDWAAQLPDEPGQHQHHVPTKLSRLVVEWPAVARWHNISAGAIGGLRRDEIAERVVQVSCITRAPSSAGERRASSVVFSGDTREREFVELELGTVLDMADAAEHGTEHPVQAAANLDFYLCQCAISAPGTSFAHWHPRAAAPPAARLRGSSPEAGLWPDCDTHNVLVRPERSPSSPVIEGRAPR